MQCEDRDRAAVQDSAGAGCSPSSTRSTLGAAVLHRTRGREARGAGRVAKTGTQEEDAEGMENTWLRVAALIYQTSGRHSLHISS